MALSTSAPTLLDFARRQDFDGKIAKIFELIEPVNEVLQDIPWVECNQGTSHKTTIRTGYPEPTWRMLNYGVQPTKSQTRQVADATGMLEAYAEVDKALAQLNDNKAEWRLSEDRAHLVGMQKSFLSTLFYGDTTVNPDRFVGLAPRFSVPSAIAPEDGGGSGFQLIDGGAADGQTDCTSIWIIGWGENTVHGIYPKGSKAGWTYEDLGEDTLADAAGGKYQGYRSHYKWDCGLTVRDPRYIVRIANIDTSALTTDASSGAKLVNLLTSGLERMADLNMGKPAIYGNRKIRSILRHQVKSEVKAGGGLTFENIAGKHVLAFDGVPFRRVDSILNTETAIADAAGTFYGD